MTTSTAAVAAVDCGTNSIRLLVAAADGSPLDRLMTITRLGEGVDETHRLADGAVARTAEVLRSYREVMDRHGVHRVRMTATSAVRDATNRTAFFDAAYAAVGVVPEVLSGAEEAALSYAGATAELDGYDGPWLVADIGGGSTELAFGSERLVPASAVSLDVGCVRVTERFLRHDPPTDAELDAARAMVDETLGGAFAADPALRSATTVVGLAGTVAAAAALDLRLAHHDRSATHHHRLRAGTVRDLLVELAALDEAGRQARPGMEHARAGVIVGGLVVLDGLLRVTTAGELLVSESDILDGLVMSLLA